MIADMARSALTVLLAGLCFGAGLPALFTVGLMLRSRASPHMRADGTTRGSALALVGAVLCFAIVLCAVVIGVLWITRKSLDHYLGISVFG